MQYLDFIMGSIREDKYVAFMRIRFEAALHDGGKSVYGSSLIYHPKNIGYIFDWCTITDRSIISYLFLR